MSTTSFLSTIDKKISQVGPLAKLIDAISLRILPKAPAQAGCSGCGFCYSYCNSNHDVCVNFSCGAGCGCIQCGFGKC